MHLSITATAFRLRLKSTRLSHAVGRDPNVVGDPNRGRYVYPDVGEYVDTDIGGDVFSRLLGKIPFSRNFSIILVSVFLSGSEKDLSNIILGERDGLFTTFIPVFNEDDGELMEDDGELMEDDGELMEDDGELMEDEDDGELLGDEDDGELMEDEDDGELMEDEDDGKLIEDSFLALLRLNRDDLPKLPKILDPDLLSCCLLSTGDVNADATISDINSEKLLGPPSAPALRGP